VLLLVLRDLLLCGTDIVAKPSPGTHATRRRSDDHEEGVTVASHRVDAIDAKFKLRNR
jgi:hypothetical protein